MLLKFVFQLEDRFAAFAEIKVAFHMIFQLRDPNEVDEAHVTGPNVPAQPLFQPNRFFRYLLQRIFARCSRNNRR